MYVWMYSCPKYMIIIYCLKKKTFDKLKCVQSDHQQRRITKKKKQLISAHFSYRSIGISFMYTL